MAFNATLGTVGETSDGNANHSEILRIPKGRNRQRGKGDPECCWRDWAIWTDGFHHLEKSGPARVCLQLAGARKERISIDVQLSFHCVVDLFSDSFPPRDIDGR